jgi:hypothetical protein
MAIRAESQMNEIEHRGRTGNRLQRQRILRGRRLQIRRLHWHGMELLRAQRSMLKQAFTQVREISVGISSRCDSLVHLNHVHSAPRDFFTCKSMQHEPWGVTAAYRHDKATAICGRRPRLGRDERCSFSGD